jgi:hypothetical protein
VLSPLRKQGPSVVQRRWVPAYANRWGRRRHAGGRPVSGLAGLDRPPSRLVDSGDPRGREGIGRSAPAYRCGGSRGMAPSRRRAPHSRLTRRAGCARRTPARAL